MTVYTKKESRDLSAAVRYYCKEEPTEAHYAQADVDATIKVLQHQLLRYSDLEPNVNFFYKYPCDSDYIIDFTGKCGKNKKGQDIYKFGKYWDKAVDPDDKDHQSYLEWLSNESSTPVGMKMATKRIRSQHRCHRNCMEWLQAEGIMPSAEKSLVLHNTITS